MRKGLALLVAVLLCCLSVTAYAHEFPDLSRTGEISIIMRYDGQTVRGGTLIMYRVGEITHEGIDYGFVPTGDFVDCGYTFDRVDSPTLARELAIYAQNNYFEGMMTPISREGNARFKDLELGLYLIVQDMAAKSYLPIEPFLVSVPLFENGKYTYEVDASPKIELEKEPMPTIIPKPSDKPDDDPDDPDDPDDDDKEKLPQTGQMNWPVPVLAATGVCLFTVGWLLRFRKETYEK